MSFFDTLILDVIIILLPYTLILIFKGYTDNIKKIKQESLIDIANFSSIFLLIKYCNYDLTYELLIVNIPFIISLLYKRKKASIILAIIMIIFYYLNGYNLDIIAIEYLIYLLIFIIMTNKKRTSNQIISTFLFVKGITLTIENFYILENNHINTILKIFISLLVFYLIGITITKIINKIENFISLNQTLKELEKEKNLKNSLFQITHEVKNPIAVCKGYLSMMDYSDLEKVKKYNKIIENELNRTLDIMDNFSRYTKIKVELDIMDLSCLLEDTIESMKIMLDNRGINLKYNFQDELYINGDYNRLKQVLVNIIKNSCEAINGPGNIEIKTRINANYVYLIIKDDGPGMTGEELEKIDKLFYSSKEKGCGIGVTLSKEILKLHNGELKYKSKKDKYTEAIIKLPKLEEKTI